MVSWDGAARTDRFAIGTAGFSAPLLRSGRNDGSVGDRSAIGTAGFSAPLRSGRNDGSVGARFLETGGGEFLQDVGGEVAYVAHFFEFGGLEGDAELLFDGDDKGYVVEAVPAGDLGGG